MVRRSMPFVLVALVAGGLVACGFGGAPDAVVLEGKAVGRPGAPVLGVAFTMVDLSAVTSAGMIPVGNAMYVTGLQPVEVDGSFRLPLPSPADVPAAALTPADAFLFEPPPGCTLSADPVAARVSGHLFDEQGIIPGVIAVSTDGLAYTIVSETPVDMNDLASYDGRFLAWLYADRPVAIAAVGAGCAGKLDLLLALDAGWNAIGWTYDQVADAFTVRGAADAGRVIATLFPPATP